MYNIYIINNKIYRICD